MDARGRPRVELCLLPMEPTRHTETVLLRVITQDGEIVQTDVKASEPLMLLFYIVCAMRHISPDLPCLGSTFLRWR